MEALVAEGTLGSSPEPCAIGVTAPGGSTTKRSWQQLRQAVRQTRCRLYGLASRLPSSVVFGKGRLYFLSPLTEGRESSLHYVDLPPLQAQGGSTEATGLVGVGGSNGSSGNEGVAGAGGTLGSAAPPVLQWRPLLDPKFHRCHPPGRLSREEQLQWERRRLMAWGITSFDYQGGRFVFPAGGSLFFCDDMPLGGPHFPVELRTSLSCARLNAQLCPCNGDVVAFVAAGDLWVTHLGSGAEARLTHTRSEGATVSESPVSVGVPSYVTQEEFNRYVGFWWCPMVDAVGTYRILYEVVDESDVEVLQLPSFGEDGTAGTEEHRFPRAGSPNARSSLALAQFSLSHTGQIEKVCLLSLTEPLSSLSPSSEYLLRAGWTPDGSAVWAELLDRPQQRLQLVLFPLSCFQPPEGLQQASAQSLLLWQETSQVWINVHDVLIFLRPESPQELRLLWASEESGFRHLYLLRLRTDGQAPCTALPLPSGHGSDRLVYKTQLTAGEWEVSEKDVWVDESRRLVYFVSLKDTPLERHLYVVGLDGQLPVSRLTEPGYSHSIFMDQGCSMFVTVKSSLSEPPSSAAYGLNHLEEPSCPPSPRLLAVLLEPSRPVVMPLLDGASVGGYQEPELFSHTISSGHVVFGLVFKPAHLEPQRRYPTVLTIYGGPEVQLVTNSFKGMRHLRQHLLASENYAVVVVDCRGSRHRGIEFESHIKGRMGTVEIADHVEVLQWLAQEKDYIDLSRVAIHGWSYGGYLSLMGLAQRPDIFKVAVAGAPVTSWGLYDTGYTERYMGAPQDNPQGYRRGSVLSYISQLPSEQNRLLIVHGLMDENVHFTHTSQLVAALVKAGKPYQLQVYPAERHSLRHLDTSEHYETTLLSFLQDNL
ncbi:dipeptidyl peptidase 9-like [Dermacentor andersoni]|uniref:dipeptidyl peptidase 9-like n=1 Tax=Dermacentor andersoni TaxID=34620 RepID=UPI0021552C78|nr:dipeptidyl peptidase 9-like [Dermacentor andersoni]XP_050035516.1 dipeptidyl peptidase 9-like [Dermacentor andersoni]XP_054927479.1 dipeptidyl peptidase 9-like [Dermacentor andersoni]XP_054927480.1 dipeptidyl peptidase 9-like [Dermacentor andersoni]XP_054927481.1 dipeptidyl peptidase 9-like [Dermacentor andersoni]XP_054927482.1 dipeptidyl peptidase 9-like [Dermacentor andersoni]